jgi:hypothetical protein
LACRLAQAHPAQGAAAPAYAWVVQSSDAVARIAKVRRWLKNRRIDTQTLYEPIITHVLTQWANRDVTIMLDGCFVYGAACRCCASVFRTATARCRSRRMWSRPKAWLPWSYVSQCSLMSPPCSPERAVSRFLLTAGFAFGIGRECRSLNWDYIIRIANNTTITFADGRTITPETLGIKRGMRRYLPRVRLTLEAHWQCNLAITWTRATAKCPAELCVVMTNLHADRWVLRHYLKRMQIAESFRDDKSGGFDLDASRLTDPKRLDALLLALAIAVLWMYELGEKVLSDKQRRTIDPGYKRQLSVFQLGWRQLHRALSCSLLLTFSLALHPFRPEPVSNSVSYQV